MVSDMDSTPIMRVRLFNRTVASAIGALDPQFLGRDRPMGESRTLWEIGPSGVEIRELRERLGLDSGYLARLLRSLERQGLVASETDPSDARVRLVRLTAAGERERAEVDRRSDAFAASLLEPLSSEDRERLLAAMGDVQRLVVRAQTSIAEEPATSAAVRRCFGRYVAELDERFEAGFDVLRSNRAEASDLTPPAGVVLVARLRAQPVGCGALRLHPDGVAELKRMWVAPEVRGLGIGSRLLESLEQRAALEGARLIRLETNRVLSEALSLYRRSGYLEVPAFNAEPYAHHWFEKRFGDAGGTSSTALAGRPSSTASIAIPARRPARIPVRVIRTARRVRRGWRRA